MTSTRAVVDASALVTLLIDHGPRGGTVAARLAGTQLHAPDHLAIDVMSALRRLRLAGTLGAPEATLALDGYGSLPIQLWPLALLSERTWQLGDNLSAYDAAYVALAERLDAPLITTDARLARASGPVCAIELLGESA